MQSSFAPELLTEPAMQSSEKILRTCVHCGFCTATSSIARAGAST
jgi:glycolate oxidase iron-sulfur subunit